MIRGRDWKGIRLEFIGLFGPANTCSDNRQQHPPSPRFSRSGFASERAGADNVVMHLGFINVTGGGRRRPFVIL